MKRAIGTMVGLVAVILLSTPGVVGAQAQGRRYLPVQPGASLPAAPYSAYAPDHVMVRLTAEGYARSRLASLTEAGETAPDAKTGLATLDARIRSVGVTRIAKAYGSFPRRDLAENLGVHRVFRFDVPATSDIPAVAAQLAADPTVEFAVPDLRVYLATIPNDPTYIANWGHDNTGQLPAFDPVGSWDHTLGPVGMPGFDADADLAWNAPSGFGSAGVVIAILDSGVDPSHPDLLQTQGWDFGDNDSNPADDIPGVAGHGTCCAGIAAAIPNNNYVAAGVAGGSTIMPLKVGDSAGNLYLSYVAGALYHAANNGAAIASMSFSTPGITSDPLLDPAIQYAATAGLVMISVTGNDNIPSVDYPANHPEVIAVGAASPCGDRKRSSSNPGDLFPGVNPDPMGVTCDNEVAWGSNWGAPAQDAPNAVDVMAPTMLPTTDIVGPGGYRSGDLEPWFNGTSCSAPYAAGVCALVLAANPALTRVQVRDLLVNSCTDMTLSDAAFGWDAATGYGLVNAQLAVQMALTPIASFSASVTSGCLPLPVLFTDQSGGLITTWQWSFGDGGMDFIPNPLHNYNQPGTYTVSLTVSGPGGSDTLTLPDLITVDGPSVSDFTASPTAGLMPLTVNFTDASLGAPLFWQWDFGDGQQSNAASPTHVYTAPGLYMVSLSTNNACGGDMMTKMDYIAVCDTMRTAFTATPTAGTDTLTVAFTDQSGGAPTAWNWDFGDGSTSQFQNPHHTYQASGSYSVTLIAANGCDADTAVVADMIVVATSTGLDAPPWRFALERVHPNPFNPQTTLEFVLEGEGRASLQFFDAAGRRVDDYAVASLGPGRHQVRWRPDRLSSGVYFARLTEGGHTAIRRLLLVR